MKRLGVWIDHEMACLVLLDAKGNTSITRIESGVAGRHKPVGRIGVGDDRRLQQLHKYYDRVVAALAGADEIHLLGPGQAKTDLQAALRENKALAAKLKSVETADEMTEPQLAARVKALFGVPVKRRSAGD